MNMVVRIAFAGMLTVFIGAVLGFYFGFAATPLAAIVGVGLATWAVKP